MSHLFDKFAISPASFMGIITKEPSLKKYADGFKQEIERDGKVEHELLSCAFIFYLIHELQSVEGKNNDKFSKSTFNLIRQLSAERIVSMIHPGFEGLSEKIIDTSGKDYLSFFSKIVTAFPIDADRMDYLIRDSYFSGVTYGIYDLNRIYASFQAKMENQQVDLIFKESGIDSMLRFIQSRTHLYSQVYFHKTNRAVNTMLTYGTKSIRLASEKLLDKLNSFEEILNFYILNSDEVFVKKAIKGCSLTQLEHEVIEELIERKLFKRVYEKKIVLTAKKEDKDKSEQELLSIKEDISKKLLSLISSDKIFAEVDFYKNETFKDASSKSVALAKKQNRNYQFVTDWTEAGTEFLQADMVVIMIRVYIRRTFRSSSDFERMSKTTRLVIKDEIERLEKFKS